LLLFCRPNFEMFIELRNRFVFLVEKFRLKAIGVDLDVIPTFLYIL
jgi:hypothetical protein